jgi:hypothetical protein
MWMQKAGQITKTGRHTSEAFRAMEGKIALEEHFALPETVQDSAGFVPLDYWGELRARLLDLQDGRLRAMDRHGIEVMLLPDP